MTPLHWYAFSFLHTLENGMAMYSSSQMGFVTKHVTEPGIKRAKFVANADMAAIVLSVSYLGFMTEDEFRTGEVGL